MKSIGGARFLHDKTLDNHDNIVLHNIITRCELIFKK